MKVFEIIQQMFVIEALQNSKNDLNLTKAHRSKVQQHITSNHSKWPSLKKTKHTNKEKKTKHTNKEKKHNTTGDCLVSPVAKTP